MPITSGASRNIRIITSRLFLRQRFNQLTWSKKSLAGKGMFGRIVLKSKGSIMKKLRFPLINYLFRSTEISIVSTFQLIPFQNKLVALCFLSSGSVTYLQSTSEFKLFQFFATPTKNTRINLKKFIKPLLSTFLRIKLLTRVSLVELYPGSGAQYVRSSGASARFVKIDFSNHTALLKLPSGVRKSFSLYSMASIGPVSLKMKRLVKNTKAGFWRSFGCNTVVRGVAMNPIDHPHGGRTKAIKNPRTPWGKPTKLK